MLLGLFALVGLFVPLGGGSTGSGYTVVRGDSLSLIGKRTQNSVADLREWNDISGDLIEVGQIIAVGPPSQAERWTLAHRLTELAAPLWTRVASWSGQADDARGDSSPSPVTPNSQKTHRASKRSDVRMSRPGPVGAEQFGGLPRSESQEPADEPTWAPLRMPTAKACLAADAGIEGGSFGRSQGLDSEQVSAATRSFQRQTLRCYQGRENAEGEVLIKLVVGCDGLVRNSQVKGDDTETAGFAECVANVMRYAAFPAHARDEVELVVPMRFVADSGAR